MENPEVQRTHSIIIDNNLYTFTCTDGEDHVEALKKKITRTFDQLNSGEQRHRLSNFAMKMALVLGDGAVRAELEKEALKTKIQGKAQELIDELNRALGL